MIFYVTRLSHRAQSNKYATQVFEYQDEHDMNPWARKDFMLQDFVHHRISGDLIMSNYLVLRLSQA